ncbi:MAG: contractile injection system tape measure protein [Lacibacter sp.]
MQEQQIHIIKKASLDFTYRGKEDGFALQKEVKDWLQQVMDELETELDAYCQADEVISVDQLKLDINIHHKQWKNEAKQKLLFQLKDKLQLLRSGSVVSAGYRELKAAKYFEEVFLFYLQHGYTSWRSTAEQKSNWQASIEQLFKQPDVDFLQQLMQLLKQSNDSLIRLKEAIPAPVLLHLFQPLYKTDVLYKPYVSDMQLLFEKISLNQQAKELILKTHLLVTANFQEEAVVKAGIASLFRQLLHTTELKQKHITEITFQSKAFKDVQSKIAGAEAIIRQSEEQKQSSFTRKQLQDEVALNKLQEEEQQHNSIIIEEDGIFISNAGLVLVAAFLPAMFAKLNITEENLIVKITDAVCLLHVITSGTNPDDETALVLPKLLCGLHPSKAIEVGSFHLSETMREEVKNMLSSVIEYWNVLGDTSVDSLQESFLKRNGKLMMHKGEWMLQVEQQSYDMLLQHLPWNITMIQLPWMKQMLKTEWYY